MTNLIPAENIAQKIYYIRNQKVMLDSDLAVLYGVETKALNQAVKRNLNRFPVTFMFQLTQEENKSLRSQIVTSNINRGGQRYLPYAFTEHGVVMLASVLKSKKAAETSVAIVNTFIKMREYLATHKQILQKLAKHDENFTVIFNVLRQLTEKPKVLNKKYGFKS